MAATAMPAERRGRLPASLPAIVAPCAVTRRFACRFIRSKEMAFETLGKYQLEFEPFELSGTHRWVAYLSIHKFDDALQDFVCVVKEQRIAAEGGFASAAEAVEEARRVGNALIRAGLA